MVSRDGLLTEAGNRLSWFDWDNEMENYMKDYFSTIDLLFKGRLAYELIINYRPSSVMNVKCKNAVFAEENIMEELAKLKQQSGKNLFIYGSTDIASMFMQTDLIDEYRFIVDAVALESGNFLFDETRFNLKLLNARTYNCGIVILIFQPDKENSVVNPIAIGCDANAE